MKRLEKYLRAIQVMVMVSFLAIPLPPRALASDPPVNAISYRKARSIALHARHGKLTKNFEQKQWRGIWVYDFQIQGEDQTLHEVVVDMATGKVLMGAQKKSSKKHKKPKPVPTTAGPTPTAIHN